MGDICCGFGHRKIHGEIPLLRNTIEKLTDRGITEYMTGGMGDFDRIFSETVRTVKNARLILVIPYMTEELNKNKDYYTSLYDEIIIPQCVEGMFPKKAIIHRNRWMVEQSDMVIGRIIKNHGGAYEALMYAEKIGREVLYI
ncbi:MAG: DUF1273 domain-containing protein [Clostridia bacterium]|nr:DUF1273 domain-containing protein [Clostridia bacterium]